jgi:hypothetical protein
MPVRTIISQAAQQAMQTLTTKEEIKMKELYKSPVITVEDLAKVDILCDSTERNENNTGSTPKKDNINQLASTIGDMSGLL